MMHSPGTLLRPDNLCSRHVKGSCKADLVTMRRLQANSSDKVTSKP